MTPLDCPKAIDEPTFLQRRSEIRADQERLRAEAAIPDELPDFDWCRVQIFDIVNTWEDADGGQRTALLGDLFEQIEVTYARRGKIKAVVIPRKEWQAYLRFSALERETGLRPSSAEISVEFTYQARAIV